MATATKIKASNGETYELEDAISGYTTNTGTVYQVSTGAGLVGGPITSTGTIKCDLKSETKSTLAAGSRTTTANREYAVGLDKNGDLSVNVPWTNTTYSAGTDISISSNTISVINIGTIQNINGSNISSVASGTKTKLASGTIANVGVYFAIGAARWMNKSNYSNKGYREICLTIGTSTTPYENHCSRVSPVSTNTSDFTLQQVYGIIKTTSANTTINLYGEQNCGAAIACNYPGIRLIRIL